MDELLKKLQDKEYFRKYSAAIDDVLSKASCPDVLVRILFDNVTEATVGKRAIVFSLIDQDLIDPIKNLQSDANSIELKNGSCITVGLKNGTEEIPDVS